jgi:heme/copper-type cytochrome/quinol oxidase subunit 2
MGLRAADGTFGSHQRPGRGLGPPLARGAGGHQAANGWVLWNTFRDVPANRIEVKLEAGMYSWDYTYPNGVRTQNELVVPAGKPVVLRMTSRDTLHSHYIPDFRVKEDSMPGRVTYLWFNPTKPGEHIVTCAEYCGVMHGYMAGASSSRRLRRNTTWPG